MDQSDRPHRNHQTRSKEKEHMLTFDECLKRRMRGGKHELEHNTYLIRKDHDTFAVRLYATDVILIHRDGTFTLDSGGHRTVTTKDRMNRYCRPCRIHQAGFVWKYNIRVWNGRSVAFFDGLRIDDEGQVLNHPAEVESAAKGAGFDLSDPEDRPYFHDWCLDHRPELVAMLEAP